MSTPHAGTPFGTRLHLETVVRVANTGTKPFSAVASDGKLYWCKILHGKHGQVATINEVVASVVGALIAAPIRPWSIIEVSPALQGAAIAGAGYRLDSLPVFGSLAVIGGDLAPAEGVISHVTDDGNYARIPRLYALWLLCNAEDIQFLYAPLQANAIWSIDQGLWFGSHETDWGLGEPDEPWGRPTLPSLFEAIPARFWDEAIKAVRSLDGAVLGECLEEAIPVEWGVNQADVDKLCNYVIRRKEYVVGELFRLRSHI